MKTFNSFVSVLSEANAEYAKVFDNWSRLQLNIATDELNTLLLQNDKQ